MALTTEHTPIPTMPIYPADGLALAVLQQQQEFSIGESVARAVQLIRDIAEGVCERLEAGAALGDTLFTLNDHLFNVLGFRCAPASRALPQQAILQRVLQQRSGESLSLGILYICVGRWLGLPLFGCEFLGRSLVQYHDEQGGVIIDPASGGIQLQQADLHTLMRRRFGEVAEVEPGLGYVNAFDDDTLVVQLLYRLKRAYIRNGEVAQALRVQERILRRLPNSPSAFRDRGRLFEMLDCPRAAAKDYSRYLDLAPDAPDVLPLRQRLAQLLRRQQVLH